MANKKVSPSEPVDASGQASKLPWVASDRLTDPDGNVLVIDSDATLNTFKVTTNDTTPGVLNDKIVVEGSSVLAKATLNPSANEQVQIRVEDPNDGDQVIVGTNPATFGLTPLKHVEDDAAPSTAIAGALAQVGSFEVTVPSAGDYLLVYSAWITVGTAGELELDLYDDDDTATIGNTLRKETVGVGEKTLFVSISAPMTSGHTIYPRWAITGGGAADLERHCLSLVRLGT